jgi:phage N-6-adenine-methyltransferase
MPRAKTVEHGTPPELVERLANRYARGAFDLDVAASDELRAAPRHYTIRENGLEQPWKDRCWCNPPYGRSEHLWVRKAREEVLSGVAEVVVMLLPAKTGKKWWQQLIYKPGFRPGMIVLRYPVEHVEFLPGRVQFVGSDHCAGIASVVVVMRDYKKKNTSNGQLSFSY